MNCLIDLASCMEFPKLFHSLTQKKRKSNWRFLLCKKIPLSCFDLRFWIEFDNKENNWPQVLREIFGERPCSILWKRQFFEICICYVEILNPILNKGAPWMSFELLLLLLYMLYIAYSRFCFSNESLIGFLQIVSP